MKIKIKYFSKDYPRLEKIAKGDFIDLRVDTIKEWKRVGTIKEPNGIAVEESNWETISYRKGDIIKFGLGVAMELPRGYEAIVVPRSSTFTNWGFIQTNSMGVIDNSYNGNNDEWQIEFIAMRDGKINRFDRVCQFRILKNQPDFNILEVDNLHNVDRGGYGSTGVK